MSEITLTFALNPNPQAGTETSANGLTVLFGGSSQTHPNHNWGPTVHDYYIIHYVDAGKGVFRCGSESHELSAYDSFFIFPNMFVQYWSDGSLPWRYRWIAFRGELAKTYMDKLGLSPESPILRQSTSNNRIRTLFHTLVRLLKENRPNLEWSSAAYLQLLFAEYALAAVSPAIHPRPISPMVQQVEQAIQWMKLQYYKPLSIEEMSRQLGYHRTHFSKMFKQYTGLSPLQYLAQIRLEQAKLLLREGVPVQQAAAAVGIQDPLYFSKLFKRKYGVTPSEYRNK